MKKRIRLKGKGKKSKTVPQPKGAKDLARAMFAVADKGLEKRVSTKKKR